LLDLVDGVGHQRREQRVVFGRAGAVDVENLGLGSVDDLVQLAGAAVPQLGDPLADLHQTAEDRLLVHDLGVVVDVGGDRHSGDQVVQVGGAADPADLTTALQLGRRGDGIGRLAAV